MWHEARKHERKLRGMMVDYKKRAERRREYYEKIKKDPAQFLQVHGRACKVHLDSAVALAAESPVNMMPWQGDTNNMIDRFDVRAHLDFIPMYTPALLSPTSPEQESDERKCNYERYRGLVQNDFAGISEEQCLYQIYIDELYGGLQKPNEDEKKKLAEKKASIGYTYEDSTVEELENSLEKRAGDEEDSEEDSNTDEDEVIPDIDVEVDVDELNQEQVADLNKQATTYGMAEGDFVRMLRKDKEEAEAIKNAKALEEEKAMYSGRRSRRQRREFREKRLKGRKISPPSYARRDSPTYDPYKRSPSESSSESRSRSRTPSPGHEEKITFITSFGGSDEEPPAGPGAAAAARGRRSSRERPRPPAPGASAPAHRASSRCGPQIFLLFPQIFLLFSQIFLLFSQIFLLFPQIFLLFPIFPIFPIFPSLPSPSSPPKSPQIPGMGSGLLGRARGGVWGSPAPSQPLLLSQIPTFLQPKLTPQEKLRLRMQKALNRQFKADKKAAQEKMLQQEHERQEREDELRAMARKIRMKERERREKEREEWERQYSRQSRSPSPRHGREYSSSRRHSRSHSRSPHYRH
ncbi:CLK4-associating serine/arginine rich protein [Haemorhous mexicanus]|uniref:CLK4-associating serine/arginine rich protein n=1 Tax=Haemorhous mexicanus TaxID=30427 RepID=UPI0028BF35FC|nr:CLK4-associating serine/arginine rich protein [Haemorhous mexicanus]